MSLMGLAGRWLISSEGCNTTMGIVLLDKAALKIDPMLKNQAYIASPVLHGFGFTLPVSKPDGRWFWSEPFPRFQTIMIVSIQDNFVPGQMGFCVRKNHFVTTGGSLADNDLIGGTKKVRSCQTLVRLALNKSRTRCGECECDLQAPTKSQLESGVSDRLQYIASPLTNFIVVTTPHKCQHVLSCVHWRSFVHIFNPVQLMMRWSRKWMSIGLLNSESVTTLLAGDGAWYDGNSNPM
ncbi:hypothetical protein OG21DRAFT_779898 [Imleria badia]|nr:hypothetical protein OG21DRAFT_779898 [Imleria badia]